MSDTGTTVCHSVVTVAMATDRGRDDLSLCLSSVSSSHYTSEQTFNTLDTAQHSVQLAIYTPQTETLALTRGQH